MKKDIREMDEGQIQDLIREAQENDYEVRGHTAASEVQGDWDGPIRSGFEKNIEADGPARWVAPAPVKVDVESAFGAEQAPTKRTPDERLDSLSSKMWAEAIKSPALMEQLCRRIQGEAWKAGRTVSYDEVRAAAATLLQRAERSA